MVLYIARFTALVSGERRTFKVRGANAERVLYDVDYPPSPRRERFATQLRCMSAEGFAERTGWRMT